MKKMMFLLAFAGMSLGASAQEAKTNEIPTLKHKVVTNGFWDNWFVSAGADFVSNYSSQEVAMMRSPFAYERGSWGGNITVGKWATPSVAVRVKVGLGQGRQVNHPYNYHVDPVNEWVNELASPKYLQLNVSLQPMLNLHNLFAGYKPRVWNTILYGSAGYHRNFDDSKNSVVVGGGWLNTFNVTKRFHINVDIYADMLEGVSDGNAAIAPGSKRAFGTRDWQIGWSVGCGFNLGKVGWDNAPDIDAIMAMNKAQLDALNASLASEQEENARLQKMIKDHKCPEAVKQVTQIVATNASVFFNINKSRIASKKDLVNVKELAECAKSSGKTVVVTGYADSKTGSSAYNQTLSQKRAQTVAEELVKMGVDRSKIELVGKGGVQELSPISYNRRVVVSLK